MSVNLVVVVVVVSFFSNTGIYMLSFFRCSMTVTRSSEKTFDENEGKLEYSHVINAHY